MANKSIDSELDLKCVSYNLHGFNQGKSLLVELMKDNNIICVQEHWLPSAEFHQLEVISDGFVTYAVSAMDVPMCKSILKGRPFGGLGIYVAKDIACFTKLVCKSSHFIILIIGNTLLCNLYLPSNDLDKFKFAMDDLTYALKGLVYGNAIFCGDLNCSHISKSGVSKSAWDLWMNFVSNNKLLSTYDMLPHHGMGDFSYINESLGHSSLIDYFFVTQSVHSKIVSLIILESGINFSDHLPVVLRVTVCCPHIVNRSRLDANFNKHNNEVLKLRWDKSDLQLYYSLTQYYLQPIFDTLSCVQNDNSNGLLADSVFVDVANKVYEDVVCALRNADVCIVKKKRNFFKWWWDLSLEEYKNNSINAFNIWKAAGKPTQGNLFSAMKKSKMIYKRQIKLNKSNEAKATSLQLTDSLLCNDGSTFWKTWKVKFPTKSNISQCVDGAVDSKDIANKFAEFFKATYTPNNPSTHSGFEDDFHAAFSSYTGSQFDSMFFDISVIEVACSKLTLGKATGLDGISSEHILYAHPILLACFVKLFNLFLSAGYVPKAFGSGIIIPLLKDSNLDNTVCDNYRGLTLSPVISKVFEHCLLLRFSDFLGSSNLQYGFKKGTGCTDALFTLQLICNYYVKHGNTVNIAALDLSKAFDKVSHFGLLNKLLTRNAPRAFISVLHNWYSKLVSFVRWNGNFSDAFSVKVGVRQGGILSPILFAVYIDDMVDKLKGSRLGCRLGDQFVGCLLYADDILLISISLQDLQWMLDICCKCINTLDLSFNVKKSAVLRIGVGYKAICTNPMLSHQPLLFADSMKYLGLWLKSGPVFSCIFDKCVSKFYKSFNAILSKCHGPNLELICLNLLRWVSLPILLYALETTQILSRDVKRLERVINITLGRIFHCYDPSILQAIRESFGILPVDVYYIQRRQFLVQKFLRVYPDICRSFSVHALFRV